MQAISKLEMALPLAENNMARATGYSNLAVEYISVGDFFNAEINLNASIEISKENNDKFSEAVGHLQLSDLYSLMGNFIGANNELNLAEKLNEKALKQNKKYILAKKLNEKALKQNKKYIYPGMIEVYRASQILRMRKSSKSKLRKAMSSASKALRLASQLDEKLESIMIQFKLTLATSFLALYSMEKKEEFLEKAEYHLQAATISCHNINLVEQEPDILLAWARLNYARGNFPLTYENLREALYIADRCEYRLKQIEVHNYLARISFEADDCETAKKHSKIAYDLAMCGRKPYLYKPALEEAENLLREIDTRKLV